MSKKPEVVKNPHEPIPTTEKHGREYNIRSTTLDPSGREIVSPLPMEPPLGYRKQESMAQQIRRMVQSEHLRIAAANAGMETLEEADDFDVGDDYEPHSPWENDFDPPISELTKAGREIQRERQQQEKTQAASPPTQESGPAQPAAPAPTGPSS